MALTDAIVAVQTLLRKHPVLKFWELLFQARSSVG